MEKLIVKNFGPIKHAEIELRKYVVFIGDTSTGKSVLAKLISIFRDFDLFRNKDYFSNFMNLLNKYNIDFYNKDSIVNYYDSDLIIEISNFNVKINQEIDLNIEIDLIEESLKKSKEIIELYELIEKEDFIDKKEDLIKSKKELLESHNSFESLYLKTKKLLHNKDRTIYIPAERILYSLIGNSIAGLWANNISLPDCYKEFAGRFEVARKNIKKVSYNMFNFEYNYENGNDEIFFSNIKLSLSKTSSGIQSLIPLLLVIDNVLNLTDNINKIILIEEPELNLYPIKQKKLVDYLIKKINHTDHKLIITTHSPYILSVLDTLMLAKNTFNENLDLKKEINAIVPESNWIDYEDISVYEVREDGKVYSIKNEEYKSIDTNAIDNVSDIISEEFDKLTELRYAH